jgi:hypothetical protein
MHLLLAVLFSAISDAGILSRDAGRFDSGYERDASFDSGTDAGVAIVVWRHLDGGRTDAGVSDFVTIPIGQTAEIKFPHHCLTIRCDDDLVWITGTVDTVLIKGADAGLTHCGFWFFPQPFPNRYIEVSVQNLARSVQTSEATGAALHTVSP